ncbi:MAG: hypothetical protein M1831_002502 [Alyxoria varia]|nr:MAG: hypothetical protein M1831_002502 [Alyxoria varia]
MPSTLILGGSGKVARHLTRILVGEISPAHTVHSIIRNPSQSPEIESLGGKPVVQSIEDSSASDLAATMSSVRPDAVVWAAGAGGGNPERTQNVDYLGAVKCMDAAKQAGVKRYVVISAIDVRDRDGKPTPDWYNDVSKDRSDKVWGFIEPYMRAKFAADRELRVGNSERKLDYTIVRPGGLSNEPGVGKVAAGKVSLGTMISREDVARVVATALQNDGTIGLAFDVVGGDTPIDQAVDKVASEKVDTFEGFY